VKFLGAGITVRVATRHKKIARVNPGEYTMKCSRSLSALLFFASTMLAAGANAAASEQIIFANTDNPNSGPTATGVFTYLSLPSQPDDPFFGFWLWCEDPEANNPYAGECHGSVYFYGIGLTKGVSGEVTEGPDGVYTMQVSSRDHKVVCSFWNDSPTITRGLTNLVRASCSAPAGFGTSPNSIVKVTGP